MKKIIVIIILGILAISIRTSVFYLLPMYISTITINLIGSIMYLYLVRNLKFNAKTKKVISIVFLGTLTTYSGIFSDLYLLTNQNDFINLAFYFSITFFIIPLITFLILNNMKRKEV